MPNTTFSPQVVKVVCGLLPLYLFLCVLCTAKSENLQCYSLLLRVNIVCVENSRWAASSQMIGSDDVTPTDFCEHGIHPECEGRDFRGCGSGWRHMSKLAMGRGGRGGWRRWLDELDGRCCCCGLLLAILLKHERNQVACSRPSSCAASLIPFIHPCTRLYNTNKIIAWLFTCTVFCPTLYKVSFFCHRRRRRYPSPPPHN